LTPQKWQVYSPIPSNLLSSHSEIPLLLAQLLHNRGISDPARFELFLEADERLTGDPFLLPDMDKAVTRVLRALLGDETIAVYGDFDADGITATVILAQALTALGGRVITYIPHRVNEGHGLNYSALENLKEQGATLVITVDCGITGISEVEEGQKMGLDIVITDHHPPFALLPPAIAAVDPKRSDSAYPFSELAGVGVAFKFVQALFQATNKDQDCDVFLDLVALGTVADMVPLVEENRYLVKRGLEILNRSQRPGLQELVRCAGLEMGNINSESISYTLGPRLNASGRMDHAVISYELLTTNSAEQAHRLAALIEVANADRQRLTAETLASAKEKLGDTTQPLLMVGDVDYIPGVLGVVANKLVDEFYRPAIVFQVDNEIVRGSGRSISEFDLLAALNKCSDLFTRFGGHARAAGFTMPRANMEQLHKRLLEIAEPLADADLCPTLFIDAEMPLSEISGGIYKLIGKLAPFGQANPVPTLLSRRVKLINSRFIGNNGKHLKLKLRDGPIVWDAIVFNHNEKQMSSYLDIVYNLEAESWGGREMLRLNIIDFAPAS